MKVVIKISINLFFISVLSSCAHVISTGELGLVVEREKGQVVAVSHQSQKSIKTIKNLGDLSHAALVYSPDQKFAFVFGRDGGLTKINMLTLSIEKRIVQGGNSIGGTISRDGTLIAVSNYEPGGVKVFNAQNLEIVADIKAEVDGKTSKTVGLIDLPDKKFVFSLLDLNQIWIADFEKDPYQLTKIKNIGKMPYDGLVTPNNKFYLAGLFGDDGFAKINLQDSLPQFERILKDYRKNDEKMPVYKMPHLGRWAVCDEFIFLPAIGENSLLIAKTVDWRLFKKISLIGQPVFAMPGPDKKYVWINFAMPHNNIVQIVDTNKLEVIKTLDAGRGVLHFEFTPRGEHVWLSLRDENRVDIYDASNFAKLNSISVDQPSGIFFTTRAYENGL